MIPYFDQTEAAKRAAFAGRGTISMVTGYGKSVTMALLINELQLKTLVIVPNLELKKQLSESFISWFGSLDNITIENIDSSNLSTLTDYDVLIVDESHHTAAKTYRDLNRKAWTKIYHRYFFTATPFRSREEEQLLMESISGEVIYKVDYRKAVAQKAIVPLEAYYLDCPLIDTEGQTYHEVYQDLVVNNEARNKMIKDVIHTLEGQSTLTLVKEIKHGEWLKNISTTPFSNGQDAQSRVLISQLARGAIKSLIATEGVCGEGVDTKAVEWVILAGLGKSKNGFVQKIGRGFRNFPGKESCKILLFRDASHRWTLAHFRAQCKYLRDLYGVKPVRLQLE